MHLMTMHSAFYHPIMMHLHQSCHELRLLPRQQSYTILHCSHTNLILSYTILRCSHTNLFQCSTKWQVKITSFSYCFDWKYFYWHNICKLQHFKFKSIGSFYLYLGGCAIILQLMGKSSVTFAVDNKLFEIK